MSGTVNKDQNKVQRALIYGASKDTIALARALATEGILSHIVHPESLPPSFTVAASELGDEIALSESWDERGASEYGVLFVDASYGHILPPDKLPCAIEARDAGVPVLSLADYAFAHAAAMTIGVTGSAGKTTTASLIAHLLETSGLTVYIAQDPLPETNRCPNYEILEALPQMTRSDRLVAELTSVYLSYTNRSPNIAVVTGLWPDHLEWHGSMDAYISAKKTILLHQAQEDWAILNLDDPLVLENFAPLVRGRVAYFSVDDRGYSHAAFVEDGSLHVRWEGTNNDVISLDEVNVEPRFVRNVLAAVAAGVAAGANLADLPRALKTLPGIPLRREFIGEERGIRVYNDGMAGTPVKVAASLETFDNHSVVLVAGGSASFPTEVLHSSPEAHAQLDSLAATIGCKTKSVVLFGEGGRLLRQLLLRHGYRATAIVEVQDLNAAAVQVAAIADVGDVILFAPTYHVPRELRAGFGPIALEQLALRSS